jgi:hypothetical protein
MTQADYIVTVPINPRVRNEGETATSVIAGCGEKTITLRATRVEVDCGFLKMGEEPEAGVKETVAIFAPGAWKHIIRVVPTTETKP